MAYAYEDDDREPQREKRKASARLDEILAFEGNLVDVMEEQELTTAGGDVCREAELDEAARKDWKEVAERAMKDAKQKREEKTYPFTNAANIKYPLLTVAAIQFQARAYPALVRGDEVVLAKPAGADPQGLKAARGRRAASYTNDQLMYQCDEWEPGTDQLLLRLPIIGSAFRKVTWDRKLQRPKLMLGSALDVLVPMDASCADDAPRLTQIVEKFPFEIARLVKSGVWAAHDYGEKNADDSQKPCRYYEQLRFMDLDEDGLPEPYVVTVYCETEKVVRIDPAFDRDDLAVSEKGGIEAIDRTNPWIDYSFLPDPEGGPYGIGFGQICNDLSETINAALNQMTDAAKLANVQGGFIAGGLGLRSGQLRLEPGVFKVMNVPADQLRNSIYSPEFKGPSPVTFQLVDMLLAAAKDITAVKDVLTGEAPSQQPATSTLALIEQGLSVFTGIHKRIFRSLRREYRAVWKLNARYLPAEKYQRFIDWQPPEQEAQQMGGMPGMPPQQGGGQPTGMPMQQQAPQGPPTPEQDFALEDMDVRPVADPAQATSMQRMARANAEMQIGAGDPAIDQVELKRRAFQALGSQDVDKLFVKGTPPAVGMQMAKMQADEQKAERELAIKEGQAATSEQNEAEKRQLERDRLEFERIKHADDMAMREREMAAAAEQAQAKAAADADNRERDRMAKLAADDEAANGKRADEERKKEEASRAEAEKAHEAQEKQASSEQTGAIGKGLEALAGAIVAQSEAQKAMAESLSRPKRLVRGADGRAEGIE